MKVKTKLVISLLTGMTLFSSQQVIADEALAKSKNCLACHSISTKIVGPSFKDVAAKYKGDATAVATLASKVKTGGSGVWGSMPMPPNPVTDAEAEKLVKWVLSL
ncbi:MAG: cytochrome c [Gammaproteobacteria bacterium]|jgi:cytochrome c